MKALIISLITLLYMVPVFAQEPPTPPTPPAPPAPPDTIEAPLPPEVKTSKEDTTIIEVGKLRIVIREKDGNTVNVIVEDSESGEVLQDRKVTQKTGDSTEKKKAYKNVRTRYGILEAGINGYHATATGFDAPDGYPEFALNYAKSINVNVHLFQQRVNLVKRHVNLKYGLMLGFHDYRLADRQQTILPRQPTLAFTEIDETTKKSKLSATYLNLPVMLNFESKPGKSKNSFHLNAGGYAGVLLGARTKYKTATNDKFKSKDDFGLSQIQYGLTGSIGFGHFNLYANYALSEMFATGKGPSVNPFSVGIILIPF